MKNILFLLLSLVIISSCNKESVSNAPSTEPVLEAGDRGPDCTATVCSIRVNITYAEFSVLNQFRVKKHYTTTTWVGNNVSMECASGLPGQYIIAGIWYPITLEQGVQYQLEYLHEMPCTSHTLSAANASFSIKTNSQTVTFPVQTGNTPATNPDIVYFARYGCVVSEGEIE